MVYCYFQASIKEGFLLKQTWSFQRWRRRYFKLKGRKLYYAKDTKVRVYDANTIRINECENIRTSKTFLLINFLLLLCHVLCTAFSILYIIISTYYINLKSWRHHPPGRTVPIDIDTYLIKATFKYRFYEYTSIILYL